MTKQTPNSDPTLYRKYRPAVFRDVVGQDHVLRVLRGAFKRNRLAHAYVFAGPRGTGKTTVARLLAKRLNCRKPQALEPCGACASCAAVAAGAHLDLIEIDAASNRGIDDVRALKERINLQPALGAWKVYIVDEVHMLSKDAFNALLKTLEEPPGHAVFILATTELEKVPDTVRSRCQTLVFRRAPVSVIVTRLETIARAEKIKATEAALQTIASVSSGCFRDAESFLAMMAGLTDGQLTEEIVRETLGLAPLPLIQDLVAALWTKNADRALAIVRSLGESGYSTAEFTLLFVRYVRALAVWSVASVHGEVFSPDEETRFQAQAQTRPLSELVALVRLALRAKYELRDAVYEELPLELLVLEWCVDNGGGRRGQTDSGQETSKEAVPERAAHPPEATTSTAARVVKGSPDTNLSAALSLDDVVKVWPEFLRAAARLHPLLLPMLASALPLGISDGILYLLTDHALAHDRLKETSFRHRLEERLEKTLGKALHLRLVREHDRLALGLPGPSSDVREQVMTAITAMGVTTEPTLADTLSILGGDVVDSNPATP